MASFLKKHANLICRSVGRPQENVRLEVPHGYLDQYIRLIQEYVPLVPRELLFNIDESDFSDWEERKPKCVLILTEARGTTFHYPASRKIGHQTLICCVTAAGDAYCPLLVSSDPAHGQYLSIRFLTESIFKSRLAFARCKCWDLWKICWYRSNSGGWSK
jgi:hypothetical protein